MDALAALAAAVLLLAIFDSGKKKDETMYDPGELFLGREAADDEIYYVYKFEPFEVVYRGDFDECREFMKSHTRKE